MNVLIIISSPACSVFFLCKQSRVRSPDSCRTRCASTALVHVNKTRPCDLAPPPFSRALLPINQVRRTTFSVRRENGRPLRPEVKTERRTKSEEKAYTVLAPPQRRRFVDAEQMSATVVWHVSSVFGLFMCGSQQLALRGINIWSSLGRYDQPANAAGHFFSLH